MKAYRLVHARYLAGALDGEGARRFGGRWNSKGKRVVYLADSPALAALEILVHTRSEEALQDYYLLELRFAATMVEAVSAEALPDDWNQLRPPPSTQAFGDRWLAERRSLLLRVPSVVVLRQFNFLLNPDHPDLTKLTVSEPEPFNFDPRLRRRP